MQEDELDCGRKGDLPSILGELVRGLTLHYYAIPPVKYQHDTFRLSQHQYEQRKSIETTDLSAYSDEQA